MFSQYKWFLVGALVGVPMSMYKKSYLPFITAGVAGTMTDFMEAEAKCKPKKEALDRCIAQQKEEMRQQKVNGEKENWQPDKEQDPGQTWVPGDPR
ncbi:unnamed protein product [Choristocarpus tenellus]